MVLIGFPRLARSTLSTASSDGGVSHWRLPKRSRPLYFIVRDRRSPIRLTDSRTPSSPTRISSPPRGCMENVHRGGHTESITPPQLSLQTANLHRRLLGSSPIAEGYPVEAGAGGVFAHFSSWRIFALPSWICPDCTLQHLEPSGGTLWRGGFYDGSHRKPILDVLTPTAGVGSADAHQHSAGDDGHVRPEPVEDLQQLLD